jgi:hypothetical protein
MLTHEDVARLSRPFPLEAHEWRKGRNNKDYVYITESGVVSRLNEVDPSWTLIVTDRVEREYETERKNSKGEATVLGSHELAITVSLTVKGVTRYGIGMAEVAPDAAEADKSAVTDALKRAARLFGIGGYLLNDPPGKNAFPQWLTKQSQTHSERTEPVNNAPAGGVWTGWVDQIRAVSNGEGAVQFVVWQAGQTFEDPEIVLTRPLVEQLRDAGVVTRESLNALYARARAEGESPAIALARPAEVTFTQADDLALAERVAFPELEAAGR